MHVYVDIMRAEKVRQVLLYFTGQTKGFDSDRQPERNEMTEATSSYYLK
jgi:hypothetical protein